MLGRLDDRAHTRHAVERRRAGEREQVDHADQRLGHAEDALHCLVCERALHVSIVRAFSDALQHLQD